MGRSEDIITELEELTGVGSVSSSAETQSNGSVQSYVIHLEPNGLNGWEGTVKRKGGMLRIPFGPKALPILMEEMTEHVVTDCLKPSEE